MTQEDLRLMISNKDERAFSHLYDMYSRSLFAVISNIIKEKEEAEEVLQNVFSKTWKNIDDFNASNERFYTWMVKTARSAAFERLRLKGFDDGTKNHSTDNFVHLLDNRFTNRIDVIGSRDFVKKLKPKCVQIIELLFFKGYSQQEASDQLEIPLATVKTQNRNCISDLRNYLEIN